MKLISRIVKRRGRALRLVLPAEGYNQWAPTYDSQPDNAVLALESRLFSELLARVPLEGKIVADIGCGTGRHWPEILARHPARLFGADPSAGMLKRLKVRCPEAEVICAEGDQLSVITNESCEVVVSTLALAHISDPACAFREWNRILRHGGAALITDFHAVAFHAGLRRTFSSPTETVEIEHHATDFDRLLGIATDCGFQVSQSAERAIDESVRSLFERDGALSKYEEYKGLRLVFGMHLIKP